MNKKIEFIKNAGACIATKNVLEQKGKLKWLVREESVDEVDNGWRFFADIDDSEYVNNPENLVVCDFNTVAEIEPAIIAIYSMPVGTDIQIVVENGTIQFYDNIAEVLLDLSSLYL